MNNQEIDSRHLSFAVNDAFAWMRAVPMLTAQFVYERIFRSVTNQFHGHNIPLFHLDISLKSPGVYSVTVNRRAETSISIPNVEQEEARIESQEAGAESITGILDHIGNCLHQRGEILITKNTDLGAEILALTEPSRKEGKDE